MQVNSRHHFSGSRIVVGVVNTSANSLVSLINTPVQFGASAQGINATAGRLTWRNTASAITSATLPTTLLLVLQAQA